jgi:hypothetical protein
MNNDAMGASQASGFRGGLPASIGGAAMIRRNNLMNV